MARNVTVDDTDPSWAYVGASWETHFSTNDYGGSHKLGDGDPTGTATFTFTGTAVYYWSPLWPYLVNTTVTLDGGAPHFVDMTDYARLAAGGSEETVQSAPIWGQDGLNNTQHTLVASMSTGALYMVVDALSYTTLDANTPTDSTNSTTSTTSMTGTTPVAAGDSSAKSATSTSSSMSPPSQPAASDTATTSHKAFPKAAVGAIIAICIITFLGLAFYLFGWRLRNRRREMRTPPDPRPFSELPDTQMPVMYGPRTQSTRSMATLTPLTPITPHESARQASQMSSYVVPTPLTQYTVTPPTPPQGQGYARTTIHGTPASRTMTLAQQSWIAPEEPIPEEEVVPQRGKRKNKGKKQDAQ